MEQYATSHFLHNRRRLKSFADAASRDIASPTTTAARRLLSRLPLTWEALTKAAVRLSVCLMPLAQNGAFYGYCYYGTLIGNPIPEVESTGQRDRAGNGQKLAEAYRFGAIGVIPSCGWYT